MRTGPALGPIGRTSGTREVGMAPPFRWRGGAHGGNFGATGWLINEMVVEVAAIGSPVLDFPEFVMNGLSKNLFENFGLTLGRAQQTSQ